SYSRYFAVGDGDVASIADENFRLSGDEVGTLSGEITAGGVPAAGARLTLVTKPGSNGADYNVVGAFRTDDDGHYEGKVEPGTYLLIAKLDGYPYEGGGTTPMEHQVTVAADAETVEDIALPDTARLRIRVADESGAPLPAKASIVGFDASP